MHQRSKNCPPSLGGVGTRQQKTRRAVLCRRTPNFRPNWYKKLSLRKLECKPAANIIVDDHPEVGPQLATLRSGIGHQDLAADLLGYAAIYREHWDILSLDKKHFRSSDAEDAVKIAEEMITHLGARLSPEARQAADLLSRAWTLLWDTYEEVVQAGRWLLRHEPRGADTFPSLIALSRPRRSRNKSKAEPSQGAPKG